MIVLYTIMWYGSIICFLYNINEFTLSEKLIFMLTVSGVNMLSFINSNKD